MPTLGSSEEVNSSRYWRSSVAHFTLENVAPMVRDELLEDAKFLHEYDIISDSILQFGRNLFVSRSDLYGAIRSVLSGSTAVEIVDQRNRKCKVERVEDSPGTSRIILSFNGSGRVDLSDHVVLSSDERTRLGCFDGLLRTLNLSRDPISSWRTVLADRALVDREATKLMREIADTPVRRMQAIRGMISRGGCVQVDILVPRSQRYFERLVGVYDGSDSIQDYAQGAGGRHIRSLQEWEPCSGLLYGLLLSAHSSLVNQIDVERIGADDLMKSFRFLETEGDVLSRIGMIEVGFRLLRTMPEVEPVLVRLIERMRDDDGHGPRSGVRFMSSLFQLVDGEISRVRLFSDRPAFYRRLAAMAHAALLYRIFGDSYKAMAEFGDWMMKSHGGRFMVQTLIDMRMEPKWSFDLAEPIRLRSEFMSRIIDCALPIIDDIEDSHLRSLVEVNEADGSCPGLNWTPLIQPGPLEGATQVEGKVPTEITELVDEKLAADRMDPAACVGLGHLARIVDVRDQVKALRSRLEDEGFRFSEFQDRTSLVQAMHGLATVSAVTRSAALGDRIAVLVGKYRRDARCRLAISEAVMIVLAAAASRSDLREWMDYVGSALTGLAFGELADDEGRQLRGWLREICDIVPDLWGFCGQADAALAAYNGRLA